MENSNNVRYRRIAGFTNSYETKIEHPGIFYCKSETVSLYSNSEES